MSKQTEFIEAIAPIAINEYMSRDNWVLPSVCIAQAAVESGWNINATTLFGIKGEGVTCTTAEYYNGHYVQIEDSFRTYPSISASVVGYYDFITTAPRFSGVVNNSDYENAVYNLIHTTDGTPYATAPNYIEVICSVIENYNLTQYDARTKESSLAPSELGLSEVVAAVIRGDYGNGQDRIDNLTRAGYDYDMVQSMVDVYLNYGALTDEKIEELAQAVIHGDYGNGQERKMKLGTYYDVVQSRVDVIMKKR